MNNALGLLNALDEAIFEVDLTGRILAASTAADVLCGASVKGVAIGVSGSPLSDYLLERDRARFAQAFRRVAEGKTASLRIEVSVVNASLEARERGQDALPMEAKLAAVNSASGKPTMIAVWLRDLAVEKATEAAANVQGTHLLDLVENVSDACVVESADGAVEMLNHAFCQLFQIKEAPQSLVGTSCATLFEAASHATDKRIGPLYFPLDASAASRDELEFSLSTHEVISQASLAVEGEQGMAGRLHLFKQLVSTPGKTESAPETGMASLQIAAIEKISHHLVATLDHAVTALSRAEQLEVRGKLLDQLQQIQGSTSSALDTIAGLIDYGRIESGEVTLAAAPFMLREAVAELLPAVVKQAERRGVQLRIKIEQDVPERLTGDVERLMQTLKYLLDCALAAILVPPPTLAADDKAPEVSLTIAPEYSADQRIHLSFLVEEVTRNSARREKTPASTSAMQLALARRMVRAFGNGKGKLDVQERKHGLSYQFTAAFPFDPARPSYPRQPQVGLSGLPVLIVSESIEERTQLAETAKNWRMQPREADNGDVALELLMRFVREESPIPLVLIANNLAVQDGFTLAFRIKHHPLLRQTAIIMLASSGKPGDAITCRENGISAYLRQPIAAQQLNEAITAVIGATDDAEATATLITRHSLREQKKAAVLVIDAAREQALLATGALKKKDYRVVLVSTTDEAFEAMVQDEFDVIIVDPDDVGFVEGINVVATLRSRVGEGRVVPKILFAGESPLSGKSAYDGLVLKPYAKDSLVNVVVDLKLSPPNG
jgi:CheY-like chemotaxis protein